MHSVLERGQATCLLYLGLHMVVSILAILAGGQVDSTNTARNWAPLSRFLTCLHKLRLHLGLKLSPFRESFRFATRR